MVSSAAARARENARQKDGKFGVQQKAESGLTLNLPDENDERFSENLDLMPLEVPFNYTDKFDDRGRLYFREYIAWRGDEGVQCTEDYYTGNGQIRSRSYSDFDGSLVDNAQVFRSVIWHYNGALREISYQPSRRYIKDYLSSGNDSFQFAREYDECGDLEKIHSYHMSPSGELYVSTSYLDKNGNVERAWNVPIDGHDDLPDDLPTWVDYYPDGGLKELDWYKSRSKHREGGPAIIEYNPDGSVKAEKYYLRGEEVTPPTV